MRILLIEDDPLVGRSVQRVLVSDEIAVDWATSGMEGLRLAIDGTYDGVLLDLGLGDTHGLTIIEALRRERRSMWILVLTGESAESSVVGALDAGADEYVVKPVRPRELLARVRALARRTERDQGGDELTAGALVLNRLTRQVSSGATQLVLSPREFALLEFLLLRAGEIVSRESILEHVWHTTFDPGTNVVDVQVGRLRRKLEASHSGVRIETLRGQGLRLAAD